MAVLHLVEWGDPEGPPVVCLHGVTAHAGRFELLAARLTGRRVVAVDLRGHGDSTGEAPWDLDTHLADILETSDVLGIEEAAWIGHSFGGRIVCELAAREPDLVERAVLLDPALHIEPPIATQRAGLLFPGQSFDSVDAAIDARLADGTLFSTPREVLEREAELALERGEDGRFRWRFSRAAVSVAWSEMATPAPPWPACPTLVVLGARSWVPNDVPQLSHVTTVQVRGGHFVLWDAFEETAAAVAAFLEPD
jgi:lipase